MYLDYIGALPFVRYRMCINVFHHMPVMTVSRNNCYGSSDIEVLLQIRPGHRKVSLPIILLQKHGGRNPILNSLISKLFIEQRENKVSNTSAP